jgi:hypothetical protein
MSMRSKLLANKGKRPSLACPNIGWDRYRVAVFTIVPIKLEIRVPGIETYVVEKKFTFPTGSLGLLKEGKVVAVWVDPGAPRDLEKIVIHVE